MSSHREAVLLETWKRTLEEIPSMIGRLAYLASLRNSNTGTYEHMGLSQRIGDAGADRLLRQSHIAVFAEWLCYGLERQKEELEEHLASLDGDRQTIVENWLSVEQYAVWIPRDALAIERKLFFSDLTLALELIRRQLAGQNQLRKGPAGVFPDRDS